MRLFIDTSAFVALGDRGDRNHSAAKGFYRGLTSGDRLYTSNYVADETITRLRYTAGHGPAIRFADTVLESRLWSVQYVDRDREKAAVEVLRKYGDQRLSFTDCTTVALVRELRLDAVFAFDEDFVRVGLKTLPR